VQCLEAGHCAAGQICSGGQCAEVPRCTADGQCEIGQICEDGACVTGCRSNRDCPSPQTCLTSLGEHGTCIDCERPEDCPDGQTCQSYRCVPWCTRDEHCAPLFCNTQTHQCVPCTLDSHCVAGEICQTFACVPGCRRDSDCDSGHCLVAEFRCVQCLGLDDCALGSLCLEYACVVGCRDARDCPAGLQCDPALGPHGTCVQCLGNTDCSASERCVDGLCQFYCSSDASCAPPSPACDTSRGVCVACTSSTHCAAGTICLEQACVPGCVNDRDCPGGMFCEPSLGEHGSCVQCLRDQDCGTGFACEQNRCVLQGSDMIRLPGTVFNRGSPDGVGEPDERPMKAIGLPTYYLDRAEVTNAQYRACVQAGVCSAPSDPTAYDAPSHADHPVVFVTYQQATNFCGWVGKGLPTEARWERAARGDGALDRTYPWGDQAPNCSRAVYTGCQTPDATMPVGSKPSGATPEGALDLAGNVWEWCYDRYSETYYTDSSVAYDPVGPLEGSMRVVRGGAFNSLPAALRSANRASRDPGLGYEDVGFRCALRGSPVADFALTPQTGPFATTNFGVDASLTTDPNHPVDLLEVRWDWENDGTFDTAWTTAKSASRRYAFPGVFRIKLEARDPDGNTDTRTRKVGAIGSDGWQGAVCASNQECAPGFKCVLSWSTFQSYCREDCGLLDSECVLPGLSCQFYFDLVNPDPVGMACFGE
jgi:formylglycine-generating enzyme required for sulfatase activity